MRSIVFLGLVMWVSFGFSYSSAQTFEEGGELRFEDLFARVIAPCDGGHPCYRVHMNPFERITFKGGFGSSSKVHLFDLASKEWRFFEFDRIFNDFCYETDKFLKDFANSEGDFSFSEEELWLPESNLSVALSLAYQNDNHPILGIRDRYEYRCQFTREKAERIYGLVKKNIGEG